MSSASVAIKLKIEDQVRRIPVERLVVGGGRQPTVTELKKLCVLYFCELADPLQSLAQGYEYANFKISLTYVDEENETIVLSTDDELLEALHFSSVPSDVAGLRFLRITAVVEPCDRLTVSSSNVASCYLPSRTIRHPLSDDQEPNTTAASQLALSRLEQGRMEHKYIATVGNSTESEDEFSGEKASESQDEGREEQFNDFQNEQHNLCNTNEIKNEENEMRKEQKECPQNIASISPLITTTTQPLLSSAAFFTGAYQKDSTGYEDRTTVEDTKSATVTPVEVVSSIIQKTGHLISHIQSPLNQVEERLKPKISNTLSAIKCCIGTDKAEDKNENSTAIPLPVEMQYSPRVEHGNASPATRKVCEHPFEALMSLAQKAEKFVQGIQSSPLERQVNRKKNQPSMKRNESHLKSLPDDCNESMCCSGFDPNFIHARHQCDLCRCIPIIGFRWHAICPPLTPNISVSTMRRFANFDLCHSCYIHFREKLDNCSRTFEIPAEMRFHPVQYDRDCVFHTQKHMNPFEMYVRQLVRYLPRFPHDQSEVRLVDCADVNEGIRKSLKELKMKKSQVRRRTNNEGSSIESLEANSLDSNSLPNVHVNEVDHPVLTDDTASFNVSSVLGAIEILPSVSSISEPRSLLDLAEDNYLLQQEQANISFTQGETEDSVLHDSHASITLGSLTVSSVTDTSDNKQKDYNGNSHDVGINNSLSLPTHGGERQMTSVVDFESVPIDSSDESSVSREISEEISFTSIEAEDMSEVNTFSAYESEECSLNALNSIEHDDDSTESSGKTVESGSDDWDLVSDK